VNIPLSDIRPDRMGTISDDEMAKSSRPIVSRREQRNLTRLERDRARGYSINVKQVVLAFSVEFWIIGLIVVGTYLLIAENENVSREAIFSALLFPAALSMVELARVPLAIAVRTQDVWHVKLLAAAGVLAAITVTSFSLSQIAWKTFDNRIEEAVKAGDRLKETTTRKEAQKDKLAQAQTDIEQKINARKDVSDRLGVLQSQVTKISSATGQSCKPVLGQDQKPVIGEDGKPYTTCSTVFFSNKAQTDALNAQIANTRKELEVAETSLRQAQDELRRFDPSTLEAELAKATAEYRTIVNKSQLHSYTAMVTGKAVSDVTESDVKNLEKYLIIIPSIAAAIASTLIAITAVRRIKPDVTKRPVALPDEAAAYLFGPLVTAIHAEAKQAVNVAVGARPQATSPSG
jgi:hypothetical protein